MADTNRKAMLTVAAHAKNVDDCRELLDMLGIAPAKPKRGPGRPRGEYDHGTPAKYSQGCRCTECRAANTVHWVEQRKRRASDPGAADRAGHGKRSTYGNYGCRCERCTEANTVACVAYRARRRERAALAESGGDS